MFSRNKNYFLRKKSLEFFLEKMFFAETCRHSRAGGAVERRTRMLCALPTSYRGFLEIVLFCLELATQGVQSTVVRTARGEEQEEEEVVVVVERAKEEEEEEEEEEESLFRG
jgi:hypothetical protein